MHSTPLRLESYTFIEDTVTCNLDEEHSQSTPEVRREDLEFNVRNLGLRKEPDRTSTLVNLKVRTKAADEDFTPYYEFSFEVICTIGVSMESFQSMSDQRLEEMLVINASNLMFGAIRERLNSKTATMIWGALLLPLVSFDKMKKLPTDE